MGGKFLVTMIPDRMKMYWGSMLICATHMGMFWGITLWLAVYGKSVASVQAALDPGGVPRHSGSWSGMSEMFVTSWQRIAQKD